MKNPLYRSKSYFFRSKFGEISPGKKEHSVTGTQYGSNRIAVQSVTRFVLEQTEIDLFGGASGREHASLPGVRRRNSQCRRCYLVNPCRVLCYDSCSIGCVLFYLENLIRSQCHSSAAMHMPLVVRSIGVSIVIQEKL
jgi:hypothetical protein